MVGVMFGTGEPHRRPKPAAALARPHQLKLGAEGAIGTNLDTFVRSLLFLWSSRSTSPFLCLWLRLPLAHRFS